LIDVCDLEVGEHVVNPAGSLHRWRTRWSGQPSGQGGWQQPRDDSPLHVLDEGARRRVAVPAWPAGHRSTTPATSEQVTRSAPGTPTASTVTRYAPSVRAGRPALHHPSPYSIRYLPGSAPVASTGDTDAQTAE